MDFRLLQTKFNPGKTNMAIDEAVLQAIFENKSPPTLRLYGWKPPCVTIGYFQSLEEELDLASCKKYGIDYVRRITGGGAVLHEHEITYSIHIPIKYNLVPEGILESYKRICEFILKGLEYLGLGAQFVPLNDIVLNGKKISGNAQTRKSGVILQHGTILLKVDVEKMFELLKVPSEKLKGKLIENVKQRVTSVSDVLSREVSFEEMTEVLIKGFKDAFPEINLLSGELSDFEKALVLKFAEEKYGNDVWNKKR